MTRINQVDNFKDERGSTDFPRVGNDLATIIVSDSLPWLKRLLKYVKFFCCPRGADFFPSPGGEVAKGRMRGVLRRSN
ncbi:hypothetical protein Pan54_31290 [Rubinisphaera italica]|uniref:Uncharacterized protein n=1 Tax=Rubinisphaera italica TaxID=2527969 RepID=A0A5C5XH23_9PLAN|nr:hypothetical protein Pan54_31290 [Rubinisphaera italica]